MRIVRIFEEEPLNLRSLSRCAVMAAAAILAACAGTAGCTSSTSASGHPGSTGSAEGTHRLVVATTVAPITSITSAVVGDRASVRGIVPEGTSSHAFEPPPSTAELLSDADVVFINGLQLEEPTRMLAESTGKPGRLLIELGPRTLSEDRYVYDFSFPRERGKPNPHLWTNPPMAKAYAGIVLETMSARDAANADAYRANYEAFARKLDDLDRALRVSSDSLQPESRKLLTYHDAYAYFAQEYGWQVISAIQVADFEEPSPKEVADLIEQVKREGVHAIFGSEVFASPVLEQIGRETGVRYVDVLRDDDLPQQPGDPEHSLIGLLRFDYITMIEALGGNAGPLRALGLSPATADLASYPQ